MDALKLKEEHIKLKEDIRNLEKQDKLRFEELTEKYKDLLGIMDNACRLQKQDQDRIKKIDDALDVAKVYKTADIRNSLKELQEENDKLWKYCNCFNFTLFTRARNGQ